jgi:hypothetical protein
VLHLVHPAARHALGVAVVVQRHHLVLEQAVQLLRVPVVAVAALRRRLDRPAVQAVVRLEPPPVERAELRHRVEARLHPAGAAGLERRPWQVHPQVHALDHPVRQVELVVLEKRDAPFEPGVSREPVHLLEHLLPVLVGRVRLAGEHDLHGAPGVDQELPQPLDVPKKQGGAFVRGEPPAEPDGERVGVEERARAHDVRRVLPLVRPAASRLLADERHQDALQLAVHEPQHLVVNREHLRPQRRIVEPVPPVGAQVVVEQRHHPVRHPGREVDAVGHVRDRHLARLAARPQVVPDAARLLAVPLRHAVDAAGEPAGQHRHVELPVVAGGMVAEAQEHVARDAELLPHGARALFDQLVREDVVAGGHRGMRSEERGRAYLSDRLLERRSLGHELAEPLDQHERRVPLVGVPRAGIHAHGAQHPDAGDSERPFLLEPLFRTTGVQAARERAIGGVVLLEVGVEQVHRDPANPHAPRPDMDRPPEGPDDREPRLAVGARQRLQRPHQGIEPLVRVFLPAVEPDPLVEVALRVEQSDGDERHAEIGRGLAVVPGQDAQAPGIDRHRVVQPELRAEIGDRAPVQVRVGLRKPRADVRRRRPEVTEHPVVDLEELGVAGAGGQPLGVHPPQLFERIVAGQMPERAVEQAEEGAGVAAPAPRDVGGDLLERLDPLGQVGRGDG